MVHYFPILKGMPAEFSAWSNISSNVRAGSTPVFEAVPKAGLEEDLVKFTDRLNAAISEPSTLVIDTGYMDQITPISGGTTAAIGWVANRLKPSGTKIRPVVRIDDPRRVLREAFDVAASDGEGVTLRLGGYEDDPDVRLIEQHFTSFIEAVQLPTFQVHLLIDMFDLKDGRDVTRAASLADSCLQWATSHAPWASVAVASGAFPASVSNLDKGVENRLTRLDAELWNKLSIPSELQSVAFGDYAINHPAPQSGGRGPLPSLRYTDEGEWIVWRETKQRPGNESFFTACERVVGLPAFAGPTFSWGDNEIGRCAQSIGGAGTATQWRGYGTSHHLETVVHRLATLGAP